MVLLVVVMAVVLVLVAQAWKKAAPTALDVGRATGAGPLDSHGQDAAAAQIRSGDLPKLMDMQGSTEAHSAEVQSTMTDVE